MLEDGVYPVMILPKETNTVKLREIPEQEIQDKELQWTS